MRMTRKWTVRYYEVLWSMILAQSYNLYRFLHANQAALTLNPNAFKILVIKGLLDIAEAVPSPVPDAPITATRAVCRAHVLTYFPEGSRVGDSSRTQKVVCRNCPTSIVSINKSIRNYRYTIAYCPACKVGFHPQCFTEWHEKHKPNYPPWKRPLDLAKM